MPDPGRRGELERRLEEVRHDIATAAEGAGRESTEVRLVVVTKTWPASDVRLLASLGVVDVGENRHQEAVAKAAELEAEDLRWHFVGQVQSNKAAAIAAYADVVHSVDSIRVVDRLAAGADSAGREVDCFVQVNLDGAAARRGRGGAEPLDVEELAAAVEGADRLTLTGLMGVAPPHGDARAAFERLRDLGAQLQDRYPHARALSAGMSGDLKEAISAGATHVRVGSAILGERPPLR